jgi:O-antigen/teichoic acid export membrane protein
VESSGGEVQRRTLARSFWGFALFLSLADVFEVVVLWLDVLLVGAIAGSEAAGIYTAAGRYATVGFMLLGAVITAIGPQVGALMATGDLDRVRLLYRTASLWLAALAFPVYLTAIVFAPLLMDLFGPAFREGSTALAVLAAAMLVNMATGPVRMVLIMGGRSGLTAANDVAALVANVGLNLLLIPPYGITGAAIAWSASILITNIAPLVQVWKLWRLDPVGPAFWPVALLATACFGGLGLLARGIAGAADIPAFAAFAVVATGLYGLGLWAMRDRLEVDALRDAVVRRRAVTGVA